MEGKEVDARTDVFAFGATLYEMVAGRRAFEAATQASLIARILESEPAPLTTLRVETPRALERSSRSACRKTRTAGGNRPMTLQTSFGGSQNPLLRRPPRPERGELCRGPYCSDLPPQGSRERSSVPG